MRLPAGSEDEVTTASGVEVTIGSEDEITNRIRRQGYHQAWRLRFPKRSEVEFTNRLRG